MLHSEALDWDCTVCMARVATPAALVCEQCCSAALARCGLLLNPADCGLHEIVGSSFSGSLTCWGARIRLEDATTPRQPQPEFRISSSTLLLYHSPAATPRSDAWKAERVCRALPSRRCNFTRLILPLSCAHRTRLRVLLHRTTFRSGGCLATRCGSSKQHFHPLL